MITVETKKSGSAQNTDSCYDVDAAFCLVGWRCCYKAVVSFGWQKERQKERSLSTTTKKKKK